MQAHKIKGEWKYLCLYRAIAEYGNNLDFSLTHRHNANCAGHTQGFEVIRMFKKGQFNYCMFDNRAEGSFINELFGIYG